METSSRRGIQPRPFNLILGALKSVVKLAADWIAELKITRRGGHETVFSMRCKAVERPLFGQIADTRFKLIEQQPKTYAVVFDTGKELAAGLKKFVRAQALTGSSFKAIGAFSSVRFAWFDWEKKEYSPRTRRIFTRRLILNQGWR